MDSIFTVRPVQESAERDDNLLYPTPTGDNNAIFVEGRDGRDRMRVAAKGVTLRDPADGEKLAVLDDVTFGLVITDARLTLACSKYDRGGGGVPVGFGMRLDFMYVGTTVGKVAAMVRRRGKALVGQVRYPWLEAVYGDVRHGMFDSEQIRLTYRFDDGRREALEIELPKTIDAMEVAAQIARRAARYRLACEPDLDAEARAALSQLTDAPARASEKGKWIGYVLPGAHVVGLESARLEPAPEVVR